MDKGKQPKRIQRKRTKGWRMPENTIYVGRPTKWGNPCIIRDEKDRLSAVVWYECHIAPKLDLSELRGKNLACWCNINKPCHADILIEMANK